MPPVVLAPTASPHSSPFRSVYDVGGGSAGADSRRAPRDQALGGSAHGYRGGSPMFGASTGPGPPRLHYDYFLAAEAGKRVVARPRSKASSHALRHPLV